MLTLKLAWRNLFRNVRRTALTCLLISSSLVVLILFDGMILGMVDAMVGGITKTLAGEAQVHQKGFRENLESEFYLRNPEKIDAALAADDRVSAHAPRVIVGGMIASSRNTIGGLIYGIDAESELDVSNVSQSLYEGNYLSGGKREILIGKLMAELLEVELGDRIIITASSVDDNEIIQELFRVSGLVEFGQREIDESIAFINLDAAQALIGMQGRLHEIALRFVDSEDAKNTALPIFKQLNQGEVEALGWPELRPSIAGMIQMTDLSSGILGSVLFILTALGVINSMFMSIYERLYEFGVARAIGTSPRQIFSLVLLEALLLGVIACAVGLVIGYVLTSYFQTNGIPVGEFEFSGVEIDGSLHTQFRLYQFIAFPIYVTALTVIAAIYPGIFASKITPSRALQRTL